MCQSGLECCKGYDSKLLWWVMKVMPVHCWIDEACTDLLCAKVSFVSFQVMDKHLPVLNTSVEASLEFSNPDISIDSGGLDVAIPTGSCDGACSGAS